MSRPVCYSCGKQAGPLFADWGLRPAMVGGEVLIISVCSIPCRDGVASIPWPTQAEIAAMPLGTIQELAERAIRSWGD